jgi:hypothetical protein
MGYSSVKITNWGIKIDLQGLIFVAAITALAFVINTMAVPIAPSLWIKFGSVVDRFITVCHGPLWATLSSVTAVSYVGIVIHGDIGGILAAGVWTGWDTIMNRWLHPLMAVLPSFPVGASFMFWTNIYISGYPVPLAAQIFMKALMSTGITVPIFTLLISIPGIYRYVPMQYDSFVVRWWLMKMDEEDKELDNM